MMMMTMMMMMMKLPLINSWFPATRAGNQYLFTVVKNDTKGHVTYEKSILTQLWLMAMLHSLIARRWIGRQTP